MGLDQYAFSRKKDTIKYQWRKHSRLQQFMENLYNEKGYTNEFNNQEVILNREDVLKLQKAVKNNTLPKSEGGFFFGDEFQDEQAKEYKKFDLQFCTWALKELDKGKDVIYDSWW